ncbi:cell wall-binding repeat-containing protein [Ornithinicoccus hortensis]|uniref:cell wall-binding repeat-containing protein n=1 Tax=Ornithinicoccus hortensis TaxID=82346 RepID=UPI00114DC1F4|nr:cell wall-binding repeat-containing protein [Ornithinicoccus hortensis]
MSQASSRTRRGLVAVAAFGLLAGMAPAVTAGAAPDFSDDAQAHITDEVRADLDKNGEANVWVHFSNRPDLSQFEGLNWSDRGKAVNDALRAAADESQADLRAQLDEAGVDYKSFYITNAIKVNSADLDLVESMAADAGVDKIYPEFEVVQQEPVSKTASGTAPQATEWGLDNINAPAVWDLGYTGEGIVVATVDTGVAGEHPALADHYRGAETGSDDYNWFDPQGGADSPTDYDEHGTHVTGTMVGDDGSGNQIGVAPGAKWIAAAGCCPDDEALISSMEWMLAPTPVGGGEGDTDMRPHIVNNSWGTTAPSNDPFGEEIQEAWAAEGIFGVWSNGNNGPECNTSGSPGSRTINYSVGAYDVNNTIGDFSSRGPGQDGEIKPNISAPGVNVRSSVPGDGYANFNGTSMAAPHVSGAIALLWSSNPDLVGDIEATTELLNTTAIDTADDQCGGTAEDNPVYGEGRLDALALVEAGAGEEPEPPALEVERIEGQHRYATAANISATYGDDVSTVYVTTGQGFADALAGGSAAANGQFGTLETPEGDAAPVLLVRGLEDDLSSEKFHSEVKAQLEALSPDNVVVLGGTGVVSEGIEAELGDYAANVRRIGGEDRYETAALLAAEFDSPDTIYVARGNGDKAFADALAGSAAAGRDNAPVLLVKDTEVPPATAEVLADNPDATVVVLGGTAAVSDAVYAEVGASERLSGDNRYQTGLAVSAGYEAADVVYVATGQQYADALAGGALAGSEDVPVLLVRGSDDNLSGKFGAGIEEEIARLGASKVVILGGTSAVSQGIEDDIADGADD